VRSSWLRSSWLRSSWLRSSWSHSHHTNYLVVDNSSAGEAVERVAELLPEFHRESPPTLIVKSVNPINPRTLVVAPKNEEVLRVLDLVRKQQTDDLQGLLPTVHVVTQEEVVGIGGEPSILKQAEDVGVLPVDVTADLDGGSEFEEHGLAQEDLTGSGAQLGGVGYGYLGKGGKEDGGG